jgi:hypothetical protein
MGREIAHALSKSYRGKDVGAVAPDLAVNAVAATTENSDLALQGAAWPRPSRFNCPTAAKLIGGGPYRHRTRRPRRKNAWSPGGTGLQLMPYYEQRGNGPVIR